MGKFQSYRLLHPDWLHFEDRRTFYPPRRELRERVVPIFVGNIIIIATESNKLVGMISDDLVVDFEKLKMCTHSFCTPLYKLR